MLKRGQDMIAAGDVAGARLILVPRFRSRRC